MSRVSAGRRRYPFADGTIPLSVWPMAMAGVALGLVMAAITLYLTREQPRTFVLAEGARVGTVDVANLTIDQARQRAQQELGPWAAHPVVLTFNEKRWEPSLAQLGGRLEVEEALQRLTAASRPAGMLDSLLRRLHLRPSNLAVDLALRFDEPALPSYLQALAAQIDVKPVDAGLSLKGSKIEVIQAKPGRLLEVDRALAAVRSAVQVQRPAEVPLPVAVAEPTLGDAYVGPAREQLQKLLAAPLNLQAADRKYVLDASKLANLVALTPGANAQGTRQLSVTLDAAKVEKFLTGVASDVAVEPKNAKFGFNGAGVTMVSQPVEGRKLDLPKAKELLQTAVFSDNRSLELPVVAVAPEVTGDVDKMGIKDLLAKGTSNFSGSPKERVYNLVKMADLLNGSIVSPGAVFSFDQVMGDVGEDAGWAEGLVIENGRTKPGLGGGICQVSTTLFRAVFWAGLPVLERHDHAYPVPYYTQGGYPEGFDATVWAPALDFKFKNDTPNHILIQASADARSTTMAVNLYGTKTDRQVRLLGPTITNRKPHPADLREYDLKLPKGVTKQTDWAHDGFDALLKRVVRDGAGSMLFEDSFASHYEPWQAVFAIGTGGIPADKMPPLTQTSATPSPGPGTPAPSASPTPAPSPSPAAPAPPKR